MITVPYGGGVNIPAFTVSDKFVCTGRYTTKLYAGPFSQFLFQWAANRSTRETRRLGPPPAAHWTRSGNLASVSIFHAIQRPQDGTWKAQWSKGVMVNSCSFTMSEDSQIGTMTLEFTGCVAQGNPLDGSSTPRLEHSGRSAHLTGSDTVNPPATNNLPIKPVPVRERCVCGGCGTGRCWNGCSRQWSHCATVTQSPRSRQQTPGSGYLYTAGCDPVWGRRWLWSNRRSGTWNWRNGRRGH